MIKHIADGLLVIAGFSCLLFVVTYAVMATWWKSALGRNVMALMVALAAFLTLAVITNFTNITENERQWIRISAFGVISFIVVQRWWLLVKAQRALNRSASRERVEELEEADDERPL